MAIQGSSAHSRDSGGTPFVSSSVEDTDKARNLQDKYSQKMVDAIKDSGLGVQKYNEISMAAQDNPELKKKIKKMAN